MKAVIFAVVSALALTNLHAKTTDSLSAEQTVDQTQYCYYGDLAYSPGAVILSEAGQEKQCVNDKCSFNLVWKDFERSQ